MSKEDSYFLTAGMLMYQLLTGSFPFWDSVQNISLQQVWQAILVKKIDLDSKKLKDSVSGDARDLLKRLLRRDPAKRMTALQALDHPWVKEGGSAPENTLAGSVVSPSAKQLHTQLKSHLGQIAFIQET